MCPGFLGAASRTLSLSLKYLNLATIGRGYVCRGLDLPRRCARFIDICSGICNSVMIDILNHLLANPPFSLNCLPSGIPEKIRLSLVLRHCISVSFSQVSCCFWLISCCLSCRVCNRFIIKLTLLSNSMLLPSDRRTYHCIVVL